MYLNMAMNILIGLIGIGIAAFILNFPFGMLRVKTRKYSLNWLLCIHLPVVPVVFLRMITGFNYKVIPFTLIFSVLGQLLGVRTGRRLWFGS